MGIRPEETVSEMKSEVGEDETAGSFDGWVRCCEIGSIASLIFEL